MKPSSAKAKGRKHQQWVRDLIYRLWPTLKDGDVESRSMGAGGEDIMLSPKARKLVPVSIECKSRKSFAVYKDYEQAEANAPEGSEPIVVIKQNRNKPLVLVDAEYFFKLLKGN